MAVLLVPPFLQFLDDNGNPLALGKVYTYSAGTDTPKATYTTATSGIPASNPITLDAAGRATIWGSGSYKFYVTDSLGNAVGPNGGITDNVTAFTVTPAASTAFFQSFSGDGSTTGFTLSAALGTDEKAIFVWVDAGAGKGYEIVNPSAYTVSGTSLSFSVAPASGTNNIYVSAPSTAVGAAATAQAAAEAAQLAAENARDDILNDAGFIAVAADLTGADTIGAVAAISSDVTSVAGVAANVATVAGMAPNVTTVAGISANVTTVAGIDTEVTAVAAVGPEIVTLAALDTEITALGAIASDITAVAAIDSDVTAVAAIDTDVTTVATNVSDVVSAGQAINSAMKFTFDSSTSMADPGTGDLRFNNATPASVTAIAIDDLSAQAGNPDLSAFITSWDDSTGTNKGTLRIVKGSSPATFAIYTITGLTDNSGWTELAVTYVTGAGTFSAADNLYLSFTRNGDTGAAGAAGSLQIANASGTADALTADFSPDVTLADNVVIQVVNGVGANTVTNPTLNVDGAGAVTIKARGGAALVAGDTGSGGYTMTLRYEATGPSFELLNPYKVKAAQVSDLDTDGTLAANSDTKIPSQKAVKTYSQPLDSELTAIAGLTSAANKIPMFSGSGTATLLDFKDEDNMASNSATAVPSQQSVKAYVDAAASTGGLTVIASGNLATGSPSAVDITSIPQTYRGLVLYIRSASNSVTTRGLKVVTDTGAGFVDVSQGMNTVTENSVAKISSTTTLWTITTQTNSQYTTAIVYFPAYQSGPIKKYTADVVTGVTSATDHTSSGVFKSAWGCLYDVSVDGTPRTTAITGLRITWDNVSTGVFNNGTYALYGVN